MGEHSCVGTGGIWEIFIPFASFTCKPKTTLKNSLLFFKSHNSRYDNTMKLRPLKQHYEIKTFETTNKRPTMPVLKFVGKRGSNYLQKVKNHNLLILHYQVLHRQ